MNEYQYFEMLIVGLRENKKFLPQYLIREQKKAEKDFIEFNEFIDRTICVIEAMESDIRLLYHDRAKDNEIRKEITLWDYTVRLSKLANNQFEGDIGFKHTSLLRQAINDAFDFYQMDGNPFQLKGYNPDLNGEIEIAKIDIGNQVSINHAHIFKKNGFLIWHTMFESFNIDESSKMDLRFLYEIMKYHDLINSTVNIKNYIDWVNETNEFSIERLPYTNVHSKSNNKRMIAYNLERQAVTG